MRRGKPEYVLRAATEEGKFEEEHWRVRKDGVRFWAGVIITALHDSEGELLGFAKVVRDLTELKQAEDARNTLLSLERSARARTEEVLRQLRAVQAVTEAALAHLDLDSLLSALLDRLAEVLEVDTVAVLLLTDDGQGLVPRAAKGLEEEVEAGIHLPVGSGFAGRIAAERRPISIEDVEHADIFNPIFQQKKIRSVLGVVHVGSLHSRRFTDEETSFLQIAADRVALAIDHARLYEAAEHARMVAEAAAQEVRLRDEFLSVAAHELRTPITGLRTAVQVIRRPLVRGDAVSPERLMHMTGLIDQESDKLSRLVTQLLDLTRMEGGKVALDLTEVDLPQLVRSVVDGIRLHTPSADITVEGLESLCATADALRLEQVLVNLLQNAVKFSPQGGKITVGVSHPRKSRAQIAIRDHGIGLAPEEAERIFERFYQVDTSKRSTGLGLGLYISREIVERHGGRIWAENPPDGGSRFVVELPLNGGRGARVMNRLGD
jgi:signal transduction histidine kinase